MPAKRYLTWIKSEDGQTQVEEQFPKQLSCTLYQCQIHERETKKAENVLRIKGD